MVVLDLMGIAPDERFYSDPDFRQLCCGCAACLREAEAASLREVRPVGGNAPAAFNYNVKEQDMRSHLA